MGWRSVSSLVLSCLAACLPLPGGEGEPCNDLGVCLPGLACGEGTCLDPKVVCEGKQCGLSSGVDCGTCSTPTEVCTSNACVDVCAGKQCGLSSGVDCGTCSGGLECADGQCVDRALVCAGKECGLAGGLDCGTCSGGLECGDGQCVDRAVACAGKECGMVSGLECGTCSGGLTCNSGQCELAAYVRIPAGTFTMGSPSNETGRSTSETQHPVTLTRAFWIKATEVTQGDWRAVMGENPSEFTACGDNCAVENVSWYDAVDYLNALSRSQGLAECYGGTGTNRSFVGLDCAGYRLPTEAEWEYAARAGSTTALTNGALQGLDCSGGANLDAVAWYCGNAGSSPHPVGLKAANAWGLYDVHGNVFEWTHDWYGPYAAGAATNPEGSPTGANHVYRGGTWDYGAEGCRLAYRGSLDPSYRNDSLGFRSARTIP